MLILLTPGRWITGLLCLWVAWGSAVHYAGAQEQEQRQGGEATASGTAAAPTDEELAALMKKLDANAFSDREQASATLKELALQHRDALREPLVSIYKKAASPEVRYRVYGVLLELAQGMRPDAKPGFLGIMMMDSQVSLPDSKVTKSIIVRQVVPDSAAAKCGLQLSDHIVAVDGKEITSGTTAMDTASARFSEYIRAKPAQAEVELKIYSARRRSVSKVMITLGERPDKYEDVRYKKNLANDIVKEWLGQ